MCRKKLPFCILKMSPEYDRRHPALVAAQGHGKKVIPPESAGMGETVFRRIVDVNPTRRDLIGRLVNGLKAVLGQPFGGPLIKILFWPLADGPEMTHANRVRKNAHHNPPCFIERFVEKSSADFCAASVMTFFLDVYHHGEKEPVQGPVQGPVLGG
jgi:hypothetical protein